MTQRSRTYTRTKNTHVHTHVALYSIMEETNLRGKSILTGRDFGKVRPQLPLRLIGLFATPMGKLHDDGISVCHVCANVVPRRRSRQGDLTQLRASRNAIPAIRSAECSSRRRCRGQSLSSKRTTSRSLPWYSVSLESRPSKRATNKHERAAYFFFVRTNDASLEQNHHLSYS